MTTCSRPACSNPVAGMLLLHRADRIAELLPLDDRTARRYGTGLCAGHLSRARTPAGWELIDRLGRPVWVPTRASDVEEDSELRTATSPLLRRAFQGDAIDEGQIEGQLRLLV